MIPKERRLLLTLRPLFQGNEFVLCGIENLDGVNRMDFPDRAARKTVRSVRTLALAGGVAAIKEELASDSDPQSLDGKRAGDVRRGAGVGIESFPQGRSEVRDDFGGHAGAFFCSSRLAERHVNVIPFKEGVLAVDPFAGESLRARAQHVGVIVFGVEHKTFMSESMKTV